MTANESVWQLAQVLAADLERRGFHAEAEEHLRLVRQQLAGEQIGFTWQPTNSSSGRSS